MGDAFKTIEEFFDAYFRQKMDGSTERFVRILREGEPDKEDSKDGLYRATERLYSDNNDPTLDYYIT